MLSPTVPLSSWQRRGLTLIEVLVVMGVIGFVTGLLMPAVQKVREAASRGVCQNRLKQIGLALHESNDTNGVMPPGIGWYAGTPAYGTVWLHLLPYLEQGALYQQAIGPDGLIVPPYNNVSALPIKQFQCPSDPSLGTGVLTATPNTIWGASSYAVNAQVFCDVYPYGSPWGGWYKDAAGQPSLAVTFPDGLSCTILVAEKYAQCNNQAFSEGGAAWAYWLTTEPNTKPYHAGFEISWTLYDVGPGSRFLTRPYPYTGALSQCDPTLASTAHGNGMPVLLADGSVRALAPSISRSTWWAACTPGGGDGPDW